MAAIAPSAPATFYLAGADSLGRRTAALIVSQDGGTGVVMVSRDGGASWSELASGLPGASVVQLAFGPGGTLYAGTEGASVYRYTSQ